MVEKILVLWGSLSLWVFFWTFLIHKSAQKIDKMLSKKDNDNA